MLPESQSLSWRRAIHFPCLQSNLSNFGVLYLFGPSDNQQDHMLRNKTIQLNPSRFLVLDTLSSTHKKNMSDTSILQDGTKRLSPHRERLRSHLFSVANQTCEVFMHSGSGRLCFTGSCFPFLDLVGTVQQIQINRRYYNEPAGQRNLCPKLSQKIGTKIHPNLPTYLPTSPGSCVCQWVFPCFWLTSNSIL